MSVTLRNIANIGIILAKTFNVSCYFTKILIEY